jgi:hypothetical protein
VSRDVRPRLKNVRITEASVMRIWWKFMFLLVASLLTGCAHVQVSLISLDGSQTTDLNKVALIIEDQNHPALLHGVDGVPLKTMRIPSAFEKYAYVLSGGRYVFWLAGMPYPHPLIPQRRRCYTMKVELIKGVRYLLKEEVGTKKALLMREDTRETVSIGNLVDEPWVFLRGCKWQ